MQEEGGANTKPNNWVESQPAIHQEDQVKKEEGQAELDQDLSWNVPQQFSARTQLLLNDF